MRPDPYLICLVVRDHGIGISEADQVRIFDRFERVVTSRPNTGFGIGLWIVRQLVEAMGGRIAVHNHPGNGSAFAVMLPRAPDEAGAGPSDCVAAFMTRTRNPCRRR